MYLKTIEIRGFKSFADKTEINLKNGVTSIVGPNGSGKSNISDAVRWVLGEQSVKNLRGDKMEDVIFAGTQFRKPVGLCQVSLVLDNSDHSLPLDYDEITITRRLYRSGDSEYYINNTSCRLKDIQQMFMDTGLGKQGYSMISQGKIDNVLSGKPEERRNLLEEAAGIVKFKTRKEEARRKLENTDSNLIRINDILSTYEERLEPLRVESEKANAFIHLSGELKEKEVNLIVHSVEKILMKVEAMKNGRVQAENNHGALKKENEKYKSELQELNAELENFEQVVSGEKQSYYEKKEKLQNTISSNDLLNERINNLINNIGKIKEEIKSLQAKANDINASKNNEESNLEAFKKEQNSINEEITNAEKILKDANESIVDKEETVRTLKDDAIELLSLISDKKNEMNMLNSETNNMERKLQALKTSTESFKNSIKINLSTKDQLITEVDSMRSKIDKFEESIREHKREIRNILSGFQKKETEHRIQTNFMSKTEANIQMLSNLEKQYEGYNRSVKTLMQHVAEGKANVKQSSIGVLGEIINVRREYETATEIALGAAISDIITDDEHTAKMLIGYLKEKNLGRATFLPLNIIKGRKLELNPRIPTIRGFIGIASNLIGFDSKHAPAIEHVLGRTVFAEDMDSALNIAKASGHSFKIVTLSGDVVNPGGSLTGGSVAHKNSSIISRKREIEELKNKHEEIKASLAKLASSMESDKNSMKSLDDECLNLKDAIFNENIECTKIQGKIEAISGETEKLQDNLKISNNEIQLIIDKLEENNNEVNKNNFQLAELNDKQRENEQKISEIEEDLLSHAKHVGDYRENLTKLKIKKAQIDEGVLNKIKELERLDRELMDLVSKVEHLTIEMNDNEGNLHKSQEEMQANKGEIVQMEKRLEVMEKAFEEIEAKRIDIREKIKNKASQLEDSADLLKKAEAELHKCEISLAKYETEKEGIFAKLNEELGITYAEALEYKNHIEDIDSYKNSISELKAQISSLGVVNVGSIEEYKEVKEKHAFMDSQREDLLQAKEELVAVIEEMTSNMRGVFNENFNKLRINFNDTFRELFKGGSADLILNGEDELTANIDINVQPPGKKLQNINLMSGGEKGLSAIALLFAILKMKPTPFCFLDEIEAALDDANVSRYADFLKKFSKDIQFIVITHRKGTMGASDALYGVTMQEKGISKIVSVELAV